MNPDPKCGFSGEIDFQGNATEPKVWLPHLARNRVRTLQSILDKLQGPVAVCPVLPLSQRDPKAADRLIAEYENEHGPLPAESRQRAHQFLVEAGLIDDEPQRAAG